MDEKFRVPPTKLGVYLWIMDIRPKDVYGPLAMTPAYFSHLIWGTRTEKPPFERIAAFLDVPLSEIYEGEPPKGRPRKET